MANFDTRFKSNTVEWATPPELYDPLNSEFGFTLDVAATPENAKCARYYTREDDGLSQPWDGVCWMNPPYGRDIPKWLARALDESKRGVTTVCLIPARTNTNWFHDLCLSVAEVRFVKGRPKFGDADHGLPLPLAVVVYRPRYGSVCMANAQGEAQPHEQPERKPNMKESENDNNAADGSVESTDLFCLPNLPPPEIVHTVLPDDYRYGHIRAYTAKQMQDYAIKCIRNQLHLQNSKDHV